MTFSLANRSHLLGQKIVYKYQFINMFQLNIKYLWAFAPNQLAALDLLKLWHSVFRSQINKLT